MCWLQRFFEELQRDRTLRSTDLFQMFLSVQSRKEFDAKVKAISKLPAPRNVSLIKSLEGQADTTLNSHKKMLANAVRLHAQNTPTIYHNLIVSMTDTSKIVKRLTDALARDANLCRMMSLSYASIEVPPTQITAW